MYVPVNHDVNRYDWIIEFVRSRYDIKDPKWTELDYANYILVYFVSRTQRKNGEFTGAPPIVVYDRRCHWDVNELDALEKEEFLKIVDRLLTLSDVDRK